MCLRILLTNEIKQKGLHFVSFTFVFFLNKRKTFAIFHSPGTLLVDRDRFISFVKNGPILAPASYKKLGLVPSGPVLYNVDAFK